MLARNADARRRIASRYVRGALVVVVVLGASRFGQGRMHEVLVPLAVYSGLALPALWWLERRRQP